MDTVVRRCTDDFYFHTLFTQIHQFCAVDLSAFYFDVRKDAVYCDRPDSVRRRAARTVMAQLFDCLTAWLAPILCFTAEEAWRSRNSGPMDSVHLREYTAITAGWRDDALAAKWAKIRQLRRVVTGAIELERAEKRIGASLQANPTVYAGADLLAGMQGVDPAEVFITSGATLVEGDGPSDAYRLP